MKSQQLIYEIEKLPTSSGIYQYFDKENKLIYIGKAKNLKKRVNSYFTKNHDSKKLQNLVEKINNIKYILTNNEYDALLLENNLIRKHKPFYNIQFRDDKTYPWICIKNEAFPRVFFTRKFAKDGSQYYGPYSSPKVVQSLLSFIREVYPLRSCSLDLREEKINQKKYKVCLDYHIKKCKGPCEGFQKPDNYEENINQIKEILKGNFTAPLEFMKEKMQGFASKLKFEEAGQIKEKINTLKNYQAKSVVVNTSINDVDVFSIINDENYAYVNFMKIVNGSIIQSYNLEIKKKLEENLEDLFAYAIIHIRELFDSSSKEIYLPFEINLDIPEAKISIPKIGDKKKILDLSFYNLKHYRQNRLEKLNFLDPGASKDRIMKQMQKDLNLKNEPRYIECFDNSNLQGTNPVAACVVFREGKPSKKEYRKFSIKTVEGPDDFASMKEVIYRRYKKLIESKVELPQLIIIDGGKGQLSAAFQSLKELNLIDQIQILSIAKKLEEIYFPGDPNPLYLDKTSESLKIIQRLRDEAHRFGLNFHRQ
jgi:excinuclease ABC subunit C